MCEGVERVRVMCSRLSAWVCVCMIGDRWVDTQGVCLREWHTVCFDRFGLLRSKAVARGRVNGPRELDGVEGVFLI